MVNAEFSLESFLAQKTQITQGATAGCWIAFHFVIFNHLNAKNDYRLYRLWLKLTQELPAKTDQDYKVAGLAKEENTKFWLNENYITQVGYRTITGAIFLFLASVNTLFFYIRFDVDWVTYTFFHTLHICHHCFMVFGFMHSIITVTLFVLTIQRFFAKRFHSISKHLRRMNRNKSIRNRKLFRMICDYKQVEHELLEMNDFFKAYIASNLICFFAFGIPVSFLGIDESTDLRLRLIFSGLMPGMYSVVLAPFVFSNRVSIQVARYG